MQSQSAGARKGYGSPYALEVSALRPIFGDPAGAFFTGILSPEAAECITPREGALYEGQDWHTLGADAIPEFISDLVGLQHVLCITTDAPFRSPSPSLLRRAKLGVVPLYSTGFTPSKLRLALDQLTGLDYSLQYEHAEVLINKVADADTLVFEFLRVPAEATLDLTDQSNSVHFFNQSGSIEWGHQSMLPNGEVSLLTNRHGEYDATSYFSLDGDLVLHGFPIVHRGSCPCAIARIHDRCASHSEGLPASCQLVQQEPITDDELNRVFMGLASMKGGVTLCHVRHGVITDITPLDNHARGFVRQMEDLLASDSRYAKVHELGFGLNEMPDFYPANFLPNELRRGVHFGFGLTPFTPFHVDLSCVSVAVYATRGKDRTLVCRC